ncbi:MAG TPA: hydantoinase B/oxoprolinase family protein [Casimicrobiaceae bacterium]|nr:hydantoinase B/oxoprolinase family protein [Casimicrobiaceae bacterium]
MDRLDPIVLALVQNRLDQICRQMGWVMVRTSRSPIFNQSHDFSCYVTDGSGTIVSQADGIPIHTGGGGFAVRALIAAFGDRIDDGDAFLLNDPYVAGGNHLPDWVIARPVFSEGRLLAFACNRAHQSDIGGGAAGTYNPEATEIFHEGIRLPPLKIVERGQIRQDLWQLLMINTRCPELLDGDLRAMLGATRIGGESIVRIANDYGVAGAFDVFEGILHYADRAMRRAVRELPDGIYRAEERFDTDCFSPANIALCVTITKSADELIVDFTGTERQIRGFKNSSLANTHAAVYAGLASFFDPYIPRNEGTFRSVSIVAPPGSIVNALPPAPLTMCTVFPAHEIMHMVWWALGKAMPSRAIAGWGKNVFPVTSGQDQSGTWVMYHWEGCSGAGAVYGRDGFNQMGPMVTLGGLVIPNAETYEQLYPVHIIRHELHVDGGGAGEFRGGTGAIYEAEVETDAEYSFRGEGLLRSTGRGVRGGRDGSKGELRVAAGEVDRSPPPYALLQLPPARVSIVSPGGGGFGNPLERDVAAVVRDVRDELVSVEAAANEYGVVIAADGQNADHEATRLLRARLCSHQHSPHPLPDTTARNSKRSSSA